MTPAPLISVVLPCRLAGDPGRDMRAAFLRLCLVALDAQTAGTDTFEVVIVDDASEVDLGEVVSAMDDLALRPTVVRNRGRPLGVAGAYNLGVARSRGTYVLLTSDDSLLAPDAVAVHLEAQSRAAGPAYICGIERQFLPGVLFRNLITGALHPRDDLSVRAFGTLLGFNDIRQAAEHLGLTEWTVTPEDVRTRFAELSRRCSLPASFRDMYENLAGEQTDLRWLCVRMGNHSIRRSALVAIGGVEPTLPGANSDQDLGLKLLDAGLAIRLEPRALSILIEHRRNLRSFAGTDGLRRLAQRWPRPEVLRLHEYFSRGYTRSIVDYRAALAATPPTTQQRIDHDRAPA